MAEQNIADFWVMCEEQLKQYTDEFNNRIGTHGFKVEYKVLDKNPVGVTYTLIMTYEESELHTGDVLLQSMHVLQEIATNIKELLREIQI